MLQIIFNEISSSDMSLLNKSEQLAIFQAFQLTKEDVPHIENNSNFALIKGKKPDLYRYRSKNHRVYFTVIENSIRIYRILDKNTFADFMVRSNLPGAEDKALVESKQFWRLIAESEQAELIDPAITSKHDIK